MHRRLTLATPSSSRVIKHVRTYTQRLEPVIEPDRYRAPRSYKSAFWSADPITANITGNWCLINSSQRPLLLKRAEQEKANQPLDSPVSINRSSWRMASLCSEQESPEVEQKHFACSRSCHASISISILFHFHSRVTRMFKHVQDVWNILETGLYGI